MLVLWNSDRPLAATDIPKCNPQLSVNTVQALLKKLLKNGYIKVSDIIYHGTVLTRIYEPVLSHETYILSQLQDTPLSSHSLAAALVKQEKDPKRLDELKQLIEAQKEALEKEEG